MPASRSATVLQALGIAPQTDRFGADMAVTLTSDGPVTISLEV